MTVPRMGEKEYNFACARTAKPECVNACGLVFCECICCVGVYVRKDCFLALSKLVINNHLLGFFPFLLLLAFHTILCQGVVLSS